jgi:hypothetical protein
MLKEKSILVYFIKVSKFPVVFQGGGVVGTGGVDNINVVANMITF